MKNLSVLMVLAMLLASMAIYVSAAGATYEVSMNAVEAKHGDEVVIEVSLDKNPGIWGCIFNIVYDPAYFDLVKAENGDIFSVATVADPDDSGVHRYLGEDRGIANLKGNPTGVISRYTFKVLKTAPAGVHVIDFVFPDGNDGNGWFVDATDMNKKVSVECTKKGTITVAASEADTSVDTSIDTSVDSDKGDDTAADTKDTNGLETFLPHTPVTDNNTVTNKTEEDSTTKAPAQTNAPETDADGSTVEETTSLGEIITNPEETSPDKEYVTEYVTDENSELVLDIDGKPQIGYREVIRGNDDGNKGAIKAVIYVVAGVLVVGAAAVVASVAVINQKKKK